MANKVNLDAMIPRADFAAADEEYALDLFQSFPIGNLEATSPVRGLLRKPDFQRETNHWSPGQLVSFISSFLDNELIPSLILWKSAKHIFVIDGGHRLSALRAWMEDDYGDGPISRAFYGGEISKQQRAIGIKTRTLIERSVGKFASLSKIVRGEGSGDQLQTHRANRLFTRGLQLQWVQGSAAVAESSFFKINSQGTPLDDTEEMLLRNRKKPFSVGARAIVRAGSGHKYWSYFPADQQKIIEARAHEIYELLFEPEIEEPIRTLDLPLGGSVSPVDALALLIEFLLVCDAAQQGPPRQTSDYKEDIDGTATAAILSNAVEIANRITGNSPGSLGLHPAVYFYNEKGKHSRFLFLGVASLITQRLRHGDGLFFRKFSLARRKIEDFMIDNKSLIGILLQNLAKSSRVPKMREMLKFLVDQYSLRADVKVEEVLTFLGAKSRVFDITTSNPGARFSDDTKAAIFIRQTIASAPRCPICHGLLYAGKSASFDHVRPRREGGSDAAENGQMTHPYCNTGLKS